MTWTTYEINLLLWKLCLTLVLPKDRFKRQESVNTLLKLENKPPAFSSTHWLNKENYRVEVSKNQKEVIVDLKTGQQYPYIPANPFQ